MTCFLFLRARAFASTLLFAAMGSFYHDLRVMETTDIHMISGFTISTAISK